MKKSVSVFLTLLFTAVMAISASAYAPATGDEGLSKILPFIIIAVVLVILFVVLTVIQKSRKNK